jgi:hypothetical protein
MQPAPEQNANDFITAITRGLIALFSQSGASPERVKRYEQTLAFCVTAFQPRDILELTAANNCLRLHSVLDHAVDDMLREADKLLQRKLRRGVNATGRLSLSHDREYYRLRRRGPEEILVPLSAASARPASASSASPVASAAGDAPARSAASAPERSAASAHATGGAVIPTRAEIMAAAKILSERLIRQATEAAAATDADPAPAGLARGEFPHPAPKMPAPRLPDSAMSGPALSRRGMSRPSLSHPWAFPSAPPFDAAAAALLAANFNDTTNSPADAPDPGTAPEPSEPPPPMNRAQRREAQKQERAKAKRVARMASRTAGGARRPA